MFDYFIIFLWFIAQLKKLSDWIVTNRKEIGTHVGNLGIAGYTGSYVYAIQTGFDFKMVALFVSGVLFTVFAKKLKRE
ncbi:hypothetical protein CAG54_00480 [Vibrio sp. V27_P1S3P104]|uniref:hypothetical protein n=1 Tax=unclassified Vibrio TaxID=2614977 RepID=UPI0013729B3A|nr:MULTISPECIES: hypothetical protein [unclassified Vibrio]EKA5635840.1 hypothetical protein [Vibrio navarrensis]NAX34100.1 hypothetical protein [Vibrio sp. V29_P1S30P107]NAX36001.1 hypothetical protein [Vibrio sp. V27_P1S3P104]